MTRCRRNTTLIKRVLVIATALAMLLGAEEYASGETHRWSRFPESSAIHPAPEPFTVNGYDAVQAVWMIRRARLLVHEPPDGSSEIIPVRTVTDVRAVHAGSNPDAPGPQHVERYDITVNGNPLDWDNTYIRYGGRMVNLRALFTYRNQETPPGLRYRLER